MSREVEIRSGGSRETNCLDCSRQYVFVGVHSTRCPFCGFHNQPNPAGLEVEG